MAINLEVIGLSSETAYMLGFKFWFEFFSVASKLLSLYCHMSKQKKQN